MELFIINDVDYTNYITVPSYKVQSEPVTKSWEDVTYTQHADFIRWRMKGSFTLYFDAVGDLQTFLANLENAKDPDNVYAAAKLYDNRTMTLKESKFSFKITIANNLPYYGNKKHDGYEVQIEEK